ncbi:MAG: hypothetical protein ACT4OZ_06735 [Gemmatimonadota bacterium]
MTGSIAIPANSGQPADPPPRAHEIAIVGNDMVLAALPARPVQLAHAVLACGFGLVVPVSWGEEIIAEATIRELGRTGGKSCVFCACPKVRSRLLQVGPDLAPRLFATVAPPVATARYLRHLQPEAPVRITYLGGCEGARDPSIEARVSPADFLRHLETVGISLVRQSSVYDSVVPPDRRRFASMPGGFPALARVGAVEGGYRVVSPRSQELAAEIAEFLISDEALLLDVSLPLGCVCAGAGFEQLAGERGLAGLIESVEPPRSPHPVVDEPVGEAVDITFPLNVDAAGDENRHESRLRRGRVIEVESTPIAVAGVSSLEEARRRAERRRIAVTPLNVQRVELPVSSPAVGEANVEPNRHAEDSLSTGSSPDSVNGSSPLHEGGAWADVVATPATPATPATTQSTSTGTESRYPARTPTPPRPSAGGVPRAYGLKRPREAAASPYGMSTAVPENAAAADSVAPDNAATDTGIEEVVPRGPAADPADPGEGREGTVSVPIPSPHDVSGVNEYVTVKQRMAQRRLNARPRSVPPVGEARSERLWRLLAWILLIVALTIATLAVVRP